MNSKVVAMTSRGPIPSSTLGGIRTPQCMLKHKSKLSSWGCGHLKYTLSVVAGIRNIFFTCPVISVTSKHTTPNKQSRIPVPSLLNSFNLCFFKSENAVTKHIGNRSIVGTTYKQAVSTDSCTIALPLQ